MNEITHTRLRTSFACSRKAVGQARNEKSVWNAPAIIQAIAMLLVGNEGVSTDRPLYFLLSLPEVTSSRLLFYDYHVLL